MYARGMFKLYWSFAARESTRINSKFGSLKDAYRQILDKDLLFAISQRIDDKMWRHVFYANIEQVRSKLRKVSVVALGVINFDSFENSQ